jgi:protein CpxP
MNTPPLKKILTALVALLLLANIVAISLYWFGKNGEQEPPKGGPAKFIIKELSLNDAQQQQFMALVNEHQQQVREVREELKMAKDHFFSLLSQPELSDSAKQAAAKEVSVYTEKIDLITLDHFEKVRALCNPEQQQKFDQIIKRVTQMMALPHPPGRPGDEPPH